MKQKIKTKPLNMYLSILIPAFNEEKTIIPTLSGCIGYLNKNNINGEIIVVDDGSSDTTLLKIESLSREHKQVKCIRNDKNMGKGYSVRKGVLLAQGEYVLFMDADSSTSIEELNKLLPFVENKEFDIAIGSRVLRNSKILKRQPFYRVALGKAFSLLVRILVLRGFIDTQCGFKCFSHRAAQEIFNIQRFNGFSFDVEVLAIAKFKNFRVKEVAVTWLTASGTKFSLTKDIFEMFVDLFRLKFNFVRGVYG